MMCGAVATMTGFSSCKKDADKTECCSYSYTAEGITYVMEGCEDGTFKYTEDGKVIESGTDEITADEWALAKAFIKAEGGSCS